MKETDVQFKWLDGEESRIIAPTVEVHGWTPLNPSLSTTLAAFDKEYLIGFTAMQCLPHVGPLWISEEHRGRGIAESMVVQMVDFLYGVNAPIAYLIADSPHSEKIARGYKMTRVESPVYFKRGN